MSQEAGDQGRHRITRERSRQQIHDEKRNRAAPGQRARQVGFARRWEPGPWHERQQQGPRQKVGETAGNIEQPVAELEVVASETAGELRGPGLSEILPGHRLPVGNGPGCENSEHEQQSPRDAPDAGVSAFPQPDEGRPRRPHRRRANGPAPSRADRAPGKPTGTIQVSQGDRRCCHQLSQQTRARPKSET